MWVVGKTIVALISSINVISNLVIKYAFMAPTEILARQHYNLAKKLFDKEINIKLLRAKQIIKIEKKFLLI